MIFIISEKRSQGLSLVRLGIGSGREPRLNDRPKKEEVLMSTGPPARPVSGTRSKLNEPPKG